MIIALSSWHSSLSSTNECKKTQVAADPQTKSTDVSCESVYILYIHRHILALLSPKADIHFIMPRSRPRHCSNCSKHVSKAVYLGCFCDKHTNSSHPGHDACRPLWSAATHSNIAFLTANCCSNITPDLPAVIYITTEILCSYIHAHSSRTLIALSYSRTYSHIVICHNVLT